MAHDFRHAVLLISLAIACGDKDSDGDSGRASGDTALKETPQQDTTIQSGELLIEAELRFEVPVQGLEYYYKSVESYYCGTSPKIEGEPGIAVGYPLHEKLGGAPLEQGVTYTNTSKEGVIYIAGPTDYNYDYAEFGWKLREESLSASGVPGVEVLPSSFWVDAPIEPTEYGGMVLLPGESAVQIVHIRIVCGWGSGEWLPANVGDAYDGSFLHAQGTCLETVEEIRDYGLPCTQPLEPDALIVLPASLTIIE